MIQNLVGLVALMLVATLLVGLAEAVSPKLGKVAEIVVVGMATLLVFLFVMAVVFTGFWLQIREFLSF